MKCTTNRKIISKLFGRLAWCWICINVLDIFIMLLRRKKCSKIFQQRANYIFQSFCELKKHDFWKKVEKKSREIQYIYILKNIQNYFFRIGLGFSGFDSRQFSSHAGIGFAVPRWGGAWGLGGIRVPVGTLGSVDYTLWRGLRGRTAFMDSVWVRGDSGLHP